LSGQPYFVWPIVKWSGSPYTEREAKNLAYSVSTRFRILGNSPQDSPREERRRQRSFSAGAFRLSSLLTQVLPKFGIFASRASSFALPQALFPALSAWGIPDSTPGAFPRHSFTRSAASPSHTLHPGAALHTLHPGAAPHTLTPVREVYRGTLGSASLSTRARGPPCLFPTFLAKLSAGPCDMASPC